jgi:hypothetical protein
MAMTGRSVLRDRRERYCERPNAPPQVTLTNGLDMRRVDEVTPVVNRRLFRASSCKDPAEIVVPINTSFGLVRSLFLQNEANIQ